MGEAPWTIRWLLATTVLDGDRIMRVAAAGGLAITDGAINGPSADAQDGVDCCVAAPHGRETPRSNASSLPKGRRPNRALGCARPARSKATSAPPRQPSAKGNSPRRRPSATLERKAHCAARPSHRQVARRQGPAPEGGGSCGTGGARCSAIPRALAAPTTCGRRTQVPGSFTPSSALAAMQLLG